MGYLHHLAPCLEDAQDILEKAQNTLKILKLCTPNDSLVWGGRLKTDLLPLVQLLLFETRGMDSEIRLIAISGNNQNLLATIIWWVGLY